MNEVHAGDGARVETTGGRLVYVVPESALCGDKPEYEINARRLFEILWGGKWAIAAATALLAVASVTYALMASEWYRAETLLAPAAQKATPSLGGQLGGLAALAGVSIGAGENAEPVAVLRSRDFAAEFIEEFGLLTVFFADEWDAEANRWRGDDSRRWPDIRDAVTYFHKHVLRVSEDRQTRMVTLAIEWADPDMAAAWANILVRRFNTRQRERALREAEANVAYLQSEMSRTNVVALQQSIGRLLENELQKLMLARGNEDFEFRVVDEAVAPRERVRPRRTLIVAIGTLLGGVLGIVGVLMTHAIWPAAK